MPDPNETLDLWDYRRRVQAVYAAARSEPAGEAAWWLWRERRDVLFAEHPQSALEDRRGFEGLRYFDYDPAWRFEVVVDPVPDVAERVGHSGAGSTLFRRFGEVTFQVGGLDVSLLLYWLETYGGGVFLPFRDLTNGRETYGGGRYLLDTAKGADLGSVGDRVILDFNFSYHPSCVYSSRWSCPLAPRDNTAAIEIRAGEQL